MITVAIAPVRDQPELTKRFLESMRGQALDDLIVLDNGSGAPTVRMLERAMQRDPMLDVVFMPHASIYEMWNYGADYADAIRDASALEGVNLLVCNNDIVLPASAVAYLAAALRSRDDLWAVYPDDRYPFDKPPTPRGVKLGTGVARDGGLYGPCFMVALDRLPWRPLISDPAYEWWFGDDHLARQIQEEGGKHGRLIGMPVLHENEGTARHHPETVEMRQRDRRHWIDTQRQRRTPAQRRRVVPGTKVWLPGGKRIDNE